MIRLSTAQIGVENYEVVEAFAFDPRGHRRPEAQGAPGRLSAAAASVADAEARRAGARARTCQERRGVSPGKPRVAFITSLAGLGWGGSEELWSQAALKLCERGYDVRASVGWSPTPAARVHALEGAGGHVWYRKPAEAVRRGLVGRALRKAQRAAKLEPVVVPPLDAWLDTMQPDFVVVSLAYYADPTKWIEVLGHGWAEKILQRSIPYALVVQSAGEPDWPSDDSARRLATVYEGAQAAYFLSQGNLRLVRRTIASRIEPARPVVNPYNVPYDGELPWPDEKDGLRLACVGRLDPEAKGQDVLFEVLAMEKWRARPVRLTLYGKGRQEQTLGRLKEMWGLDNVSLGGHVDDIRTVWRDHHAHVLPSRFEGLPLANVEAMLCGRMCIVSDVAGNAELVEDGVSGFMASAPTVDLVERAMERAWERRSEWRAMGQAAGARARLLVPPDPAGAFADDLVGLLGAVQE